MITKTSALLLGVLIALTGCAQPLWNKPGASVEDFNVDKYQCMQGAQQQTSSAYINRYGGGASSGQSTNAPLYNACMNAKGWTLQAQSANSERAAQNNAEANAALKDIDERHQALCADPKFEAYFSKTACTVNKTTFEQLADRSKISPAAKAIFLEVRNRVDSNAREYYAIWRKFGGAVGAKRVDLYEATAKIQSDKNNLDLYNGLITWGEYNRRRQEIYNELTAAWKKITS